MFLFCFYPFIFSTTDTKGVPNERTQDQNHIHHPVLGSQSADPEIYSKFIAANAPDAKTMKEEIEAMGKTEYEEKSMTVFPRTSVLNQPCELDYQVKGFFKDSCSALQRMKG